MGSGRVSVAGVIVGAGAGVRLGADRPKALIELAGRPLIDHAVRRLRAAGIGPLVVVHPPGAADAFRAAVGGDVELVTGGRRRTDSVRAGLAALADMPDRIAVHDAARGLCPPEVAAAAVAAVRDGVIGAAPGLPVDDTLKKVEDGRVVATVDRRGLWRVQTPQVLGGAALERILDADDAAATDELGLVEDALERGELTGRIRVVAGSYLASKLTYPRDLALLRALARAEQEGGQR